jgi:hypothetical protein
MPPVALTAHIVGIGLAGPGLPDWSAAAPILAGERPYQPAPTVLPVIEALPPAERRRTGSTVRLALAVAQQALAEAAIDPTTLSTVFASSGADGALCHEICLTLASEERQISPTRFHNSVHNAAAGYWSIAMKARARSNALCAFDGSFAAGLLEAIAQVAVDGVPVLLAAYETAYPEPLHAKRPLPDAFGVALLLDPRPGAGAHARITVSLTDDAAEPMPQAPLEALRTGAPAARSLPLLRHLARAQSGAVVIDYLENLRMRIEVSACR